MSEPLRLSFDVACSVEHAFSVWTSGIATWWPRDHTVTNKPDVAVVLEGRVGGRIYERATDGTEHDWGEVTVWRPPERLGYLWHLGQQRETATEVEIRFRGESSELTRIEIEHTGWERLGVREEALRQQNRVGWESLLPLFVRAITEGEG
ncbi:MAG TPA: SRPBCC domain-containing protein [Frankiaceae bacterium]|nr:SRPBCC domain-containing protein [Frankiaceae bacterium]